MKRTQETTRQPRGKFPKTSPKKDKKDRQLIKIRPIVSVATNNILAIQVANGFCITEILKSHPGNISVNISYTNRLITTLQASNGPRFYTSMKWKEC